MIIFFDSLFCLRGRSNQPEPDSLICSNSPNTMFLALPCLFGIMAVAMELRHLRYFLAVGEALRFTKASSQLRVAQPALSRQVQNLEEEIGVTLFKRSPRGLTLTAEGRLFLDLARDLLKRADESVDQVRSLARGQYGELHVGYAPSPTVEILPPALTAFQKAVPRVKEIGRASCRERV